MQAFLTVFFRDLRFDTKKPRHRSLALSSIPPTKRKILLVLTYLCFSLYNLVTPRLFTPAAFIPIRSWMKPPWWWPVLCLICFACLDSFLRTLLFLPTLYAPASSPFMLMFSDSQFLLPCFVMLVYTLTWSWSWNLCFVRPTLLLWSDSKVPKKNLTNLLFRALMHGIFSLLHLYNVSRFANNCWTATHMERERTRHSALHFFSLLRFCQSCCSAV